MDELALYPITQLNVTVRSSWSVTDPVVLAFVKPILNAVTELPFDVIEQPTPIRLRTKPVAIPAAGRATEPDTLTYVLTSENDVMDELVRSSPPSVGVLPPLTFMVQVPVPLFASNVTVSPKAGTLAPPAPPDEEAQFVVVVASHVPVPPTQYREAIIMFWR